MTNALDALEKCRDAFEKWVTHNDNYPNMKHKNFGGTYLHDDVCLKWDAWKAAWNTRPQPCGDAVKALRKLGDSSALNDVERNECETTIRAALTQPSGDAVKGLDEYFEHIEYCLENKTRDMDKRLAFEGLKKIRATLTQPKADVDLMAKLNKEELDHMRTIEQRDHAQDMADKLAQVISDFSGIEIGEHSNLNCPWENALEIDLAAKGYIGAPEGWRDISTIPDDVMSGVDLWDDRNEKRHINCIFDLRVQAWSDENFSFVEIPTHWMPLPAAPKKERM